MTRPPLHYALARAAWTDARRAAEHALGVVATVAVSCALAPAWCRLVGHEARVVATPEVVRLCVRCGNTSDAW